MMPSRQQGLSLISLLIGLFISMLCILAGMTLYTSTIELSTQSKIDADLDGQIGMVLLTLQQEIQSAGYGIAGADGDDIVRIGPAAEPVLAWRYFEAPDYICRGITEYADNSAAIDYRVIALMTAKNCSEAVDLSTLDWTEGTSAGSPVTTVIARIPLFEKIADYVTDNSALFTLNAPIAAPCSPYGALPVANHRQVTVSAPSSAVLHAPPGAVGPINHSSTFCLLNTN